MYVANVEPPNWSKPAVQIKSGDRTQRHSEIPTNIINDLKISTTHYDSNTTESRKLSQEDARLERRQTDEARRLKATAAARERRNPLLSKIVDQTKENSIENPKVEE